MVVAGQDFYAHKNVRKRKSERRFVLIKGRPVRYPRHKDVALKESVNEFPE